MSNFVRPHRHQPTRLPRPWDSPGKNTGVGCHFLLQCRKVKSKVKSLSRVRLLATPWTAAYQAPPPMGLPRQEYWSGVPLPSPNLAHTCMYILFLVLIVKNSFWVVDIWGCYAFHHPGYILLILSLLLSDVILDAGPRRQNCASFKIGSRLSFSSPSSEMKFPFLKPAF